MFLDSQIHLYKMHLKKIINLDNKFAFSLCIGNAVNQSISFLKILFKINDPEKNAVKLPIVEHLAFSVYCSVFSLQN